MQPIISVIMSVFDTPDEWLKASIESVLQQTFSAFEFIIVDDCCKESNKRILKFFQQKDERIVLLKNETNLGLTRSLNKGLCIARGTYIARIDSDDYALPRRLELQIDFFYKNKQLVLCGSRALELCDGRKELLKRPNGSSSCIKSHLLYENIIIHSSVMFKRVAENSKVFLYDEHYKYAQDYDLWSRMCDFGDFLIIEEPLCVYRSHNEQISLRLGEKQRLYRDEIILSNLKKIGIASGGIYQKVIFSILEINDEKVESSAIVKTACVFPFLVLKKYGVGSLTMIGHFLWNSFWVVKHNICGSHFRYFSK